MRRLEKVGTQIRAGLMGILVVAILPVRTRRHIKNLPVHRDIRLAPGLTVESCQLFFCHRPLLLLTSDNRKLVQLFSMQNLKRQWHGKA